MRILAIAQPLLRAVVPSVLIALLAFPPSNFAQAAQEHLVSPEALQQQMQNASAAREKNIATVTAFLSTPAAERALRDARIDAQQVKAAIPTLSDEELTNLAARSASAQQQFAAGGIGIGTVFLIIVIVAIIIIVAAVH